MELSLYGFIGLFMLLGIVKKNGILMIGFAIARQKEGMSKENAVHPACMEKFRPIIMTTLAALMRQVPLAVGCEPMVLQGNRLVHVSLAV
jgi:multidrug efflux pump subunit AcrB